MIGAGSLLLRGLGPSGLLVSRGLGGGTLIISVDRPRHLRYGGSGRQDAPTHEIRCNLVRARLITVNGQVIRQPIEGDVKVCYGADEFRVTSALPRVSRRVATVDARMVRGRRLEIFARLVRDGDDA